MRRYWRRVVGRSGLKGETITAFGGLPIAPFLKDPGSIPGKSGRIGECSGEVIDRGRELFDFARFVERCQPCLPALG